VLECTGRNPDRDRCQCTIRRLPYSAGRDTTAQGLSWTMFRLIRDPQHFDLIRNEVAELSEEIDYDTWRSMHATTAVFEEGLRLHPR
jgi:cytochrome P450